jgi:RNase adapter protein RapZ
VRIVIITGLSGSGKSTAVRALEDEGFFCLDNLPVKLMPTFIDLVDKSTEKVSDVALVMDIRSRDFLSGFEQVVEEILDTGQELEILFFDATDEVLIRRFSETRRRHPALEGRSVTDGIRFEREQLSGLRRMATKVFDTSEMNVHQLREKVLAYVRGEQRSREMSVLLQSFGFRYGIPLESDLILDVRFLRNPYFVTGLKELSGLDPAVRDYVMGQDETQEFLARLTALLEFLLPAYSREGKSYLTVSIGCTGGRHRSVVVTEALAVFFAGQQVNYKVTHRDMEKG